MYETVECEMLLFNPITNQSEQNINVPNTSVNSFQITCSQEWLQECQVYVDVESNKKPDMLPHQNGMT